MTGLTETSETSEERIKVGLLFFSKKPQKTRRSAVLPLLTMQTRQIVWLVSASVGCRIPSD